MKKVLTLSLLFLTTLQIVAQTNKTTNKGGKGGKGAGGETVITLGARVQYFIPTTTQQRNTSPLLFLKNGQSVGLDLTLIPKKGTTRYKLAVDYFTGKNDKNSVLTYAKEKNIVYSNYIFSKTNPSGFSILASPQLMLFPKCQNKKLPLMWLDLKAGILLSNQQSLQFFQGQTNPSKEIKNNSVSFIYNPTFVVSVLRIKKLSINSKIGYSNFGGITIGVGIASQVCVNAPCYRCQGSGCLGEMPKK